MKLVERIVRLFKSEVNSAVKGLEDPLKIYQLKITEMINKSLDIEGSRINLLASKKELEHQLEALKADIAYYTKKAKEEAVSSGNAENVAYFITQKKAKEEALAETQKSIDTVVESEARCREAHQECLARIELAKTRVKYLNAKLAAANAVKGVVEVSSDKVDGAEGVDEEIRQKIYEAEAFVEVYGNNPVQRSFDVDALHEAEVLIAAEKQRQKEEEEDPWM